MHPTSNINQSFEINLVVDLFGLKRFLSFSVDVDDDPPPSPRGVLLHAVPTHARGSLLRRRDVRASPHLCGSTRSEL